MRTRPKPSKWRAYNLRRKTIPFYRDKDQRARAETRLRKRTDSGERAVVEHEALLVAGLSQPAAKTKPLTLRICVEVVGHGKHRFTATWCPLFNRWSVPQRRILAGISGLMQRAPVIAGLMPEPKPQPARKRKR